MYSLNEASRREEPGLDYLFQRVGTGPAHRWRCRAAVKVQRETFQGIRINLFLHFLHFRVNSFLINKFY